MRAIIAVILVFFIILAGYQVYQFSVQEGSAKQLFLELEKKIQALELDNKRIEKDIEYFSDEANLEKEARSQFNYRLPDEKVIIVIPKQQATL